MRSLVPMLCVGTLYLTLGVSRERDAERLEDGSYGDWRNQAETRFKLGLFRTISFANLSSKPHDLIKVWIILSVKLVEYYL
jgi:hypothetical protein